MRFLFTWSLCGSTMIDATSLEEAQKKFDAIPSVDLEENGELSFAQDQVLAEITPGNFAEVEDLEALAKLKQGDHRYRPRYRPASFATLPAGIYWHYVEAPSDGHLTGLTGVPLSRHRYGVIATNRPLTDDEIRTFQLEIIPV